MLRALVGRTATGAFFLGFGSSLYFLFVMRELGLTAALLGIIISVGGACGLFGALMAEWLVHRFGFGPTFIGSALVIGLAMLFVPLAHGSVAVCSAFLIMSQMGDLAWPVYNINDRSLRQATTPDHLLGRVNAAMHLVYHGVLPLPSRNTCWGVRSAPDERRKPPYTWTRFARRLSWERIPPSCRSRIYRG